MTEQEQFEPRFEVRQSPHAPDQHYLVRTQRDYPQPFLVAQLTDAHLQQLHEVTGKKILEREQPKLLELRAAIRDAEVKTEHTAQHGDTGDIVDAAVEEGNAWRAYAQALERGWLDALKRAHAEGAVPVQLTTLTYAATALEGSHDNGDRHAAMQIRQAIRAAYPRTPSEKPQEAAGGPEEFGYRPEEVLSIARDLLEGYGHGAVSKALAAVQLEQHSEDVLIVDSAGAPLWQVPTVQGPEGEYIPSMVTVDILQHPDTQRAVRKIIGDTAKPWHGGAIRNAGDVAEAVLKALTDALTAGIESARAKAAEKAQQAATSSWWDGHVAAGSHKPVQHRDGKEPWCNGCGLTADGMRPKSRFENQRKAGR